MLCASLAVAEWKGSVRKFIQEGKPYGILFTKEMTCLCSGGKCDAAEDKV